MNHGLQFSHDYGLSLGHAGIGQTFDYAFAIEDRDFCF